MPEDPRGRFSGGRFSLPPRTRPVRPELVIVLVILAVGSIGILANNIRLERRLAEEAARLQGLTELIERAEQRSLTQADFAAVRAELEDVLSATNARVRTLEDAAGARGRVISDAGRSVVFIQGSYGFVDPESGRPLRHFAGQGRVPMRMPDGMTVVTVSGDGPIVQVFYTGTAFMINGSGYMITNRHVAYPWEFEEHAQYTLEAGFEPDPRRLIGFLPGREEPIDIEVVAASESTDLAVIRFSEEVEYPAALELVDLTPEPGDEVIVLGYPTGVDALLARSDPKFAEGLLSRGPVTFWDLGRALAVGGYVEPLATQGIVGQVTETSIVYDAETTRGGSGGPVVNLDGTVVAINMAVVHEFGGSNLGVPIREALRLLSEAGVEAIAIER